MEEWRDQGIILAVRPHGENGGVLSLLTEQHGRHAGFVNGARSSKIRGMIEPGTLLDITWRARVSDQLGTVTIENAQGVAAYLLDDPLKLAALLSACSLCDQALPEREGHPGLFHGLQALLEILKEEMWGVAYVGWEIAFLKELGFGMDLTRCVAGGDPATLTHVSPKSGCAVGAEAARPYESKLLRLPEFLKQRPNPVANGTPEDIYNGIKMTGHFMESWVFAHHTKGVPEARLRFQSLFAKTVAQG